jgi:hypothetical protein
MSNPNPSEQRDKLIADYMKKIKEHNQIETRLKESTARP